MPRCETAKNFTCLFVPFCYGIALLPWPPWVRFACFRALLPTFLIFSFLTPYVSLLRVPPSSATLQQVVRVLSSCFICFLPRLGIPLFLFIWYFSQFLFLGWCFCCALVPRDVSTSFAYLDSRLRLIFPCFTTVLWPHHFYLILVSL